MNRLAKFFLIAGVGVAACRSRAARRDPAPPAGSFYADIEPVLARYCASAEGCHGERPTHSVSIDLRPGRAYAALVSAPAKIRAGVVRVAPGAPDKSFLLDKLTGALAFGEGKPMPLDPDTGAPPETSPLPNGFVDRTLRAWIVRGAPED